MVTRTSLLTVAMVFGLLGAVNLVKGGEKPESKEAARNGADNARARYSITADASTMENIVEVLWQQYRVRLCFEDVQGDEERDGVTLQRFLDRYQQAQKTRQLSPNEQLLLNMAQKSLKEGTSPETLYDTNAERYTREYQAHTMDELLKFVTDGTPYQFKREKGIYLVFPRKDSSLAYRVTLAVEDKPLLEVAEQILQQSPKDNPMCLASRGFWAGTSDDDPQKSIPGKTGPPFHDE